MEVWNLEVYFTKDQVFQLLRNTKMTQKGPALQFRSVSIHHWSFCKINWSTALYMFMKQNKLPRVFQQLNGRGGNGIPALWIFMRGPFPLTIPSSMHWMRCEIIVLPISTYIQQELNMKRWFIWGTLTRYAEHKWARSTLWHFQNLNYSFSNHQFPFFSVISLFNILHARDLPCKFYKLAIKI